MHGAAVARALRRVEIGGGGASKLSVDLVIGFVGAALLDVAARRRQPLASTQLRAREVALGDPNARRGPMHGVGRVHSVKAFNRECGERNLRFRTQASGAEKSREATSRRYFVRVLISRFAV